MHRFFATLTLLALTACGVEPEMASVEAGDAEALMAIADLDVGGLLKLERCHDGVDNDGDGKVDGADSECGPGGIGGGGFLEGGLDGTGISIPFTPQGPRGGRMWINGGEAEYSYSEGDERNPSIFTIYQELDRETLVTEIQVTGAIETVAAGHLREDDSDSVIVTTREFDWHAPSPIENVQFFEPKDKE